MNRFEPGEIVTFEKWVKGEFGSDEPIRQIKSNSYIYYGNVKHALDHLFANLYRPDFAKMVKMNLALDNSSSEVTLNAAGARETNKEMSEKRAQAKELKRRLRKARQEAAELRADADAEQKRAIGEKSERQATRALIVDKQLALIKQKTSLKRTCQLAADVQEATSKLSCIGDAVIDTSLDDDFTLAIDTKRFEQTLCLDTSNINNTMSNMSSTGSSGFSSNIRACLRYLKAKTTSELRELDQLTDSKTLANERQVLAYRLFNSGEMLSTKQHGDMLFSRRLIDVVTDEKLEMIARSCETTKIKREKQRMDVELAALNSHMNDVIKRKYQNGLVRQLVVRYLRNVMMLKRYELLSAETRQCLANFQAMDDTRFQLIQRKKHKLVELKLLVHRNLIELEDAIKQNAKCTDAKTQVLVPPLRSVTEAIVEQVRSFCSLLTVGLPLLSQTVLQCQSSELTGNTTCADSSTLIMNNTITQTIASTSKFYAQNRLAASSTAITADGELASVMMMTMLMPTTINKATNESKNNNVSTYLTPERLCERLQQQQQLLLADDRVRCQAPSFILASVIDHYVQLKRNIKLVAAAAAACSADSIEQDTSAAGVQERVDELRRILNECVTVDKANMDEYVNQIHERNQMTKKQKADLDKLEELMRTWMEQPGAYGCHLESKTVNGRTLNYYVKQIDELIAASACRNFQY